MAAPEDPTARAANDDPLLAQLLAPVLECEGVPAQQQQLEALCERHPAQAEALRRQHAILVRLGLASEDGKAHALVAAAESAAPERLGPYRIVRLLGKGGMGVVYLAEDTELGRRVALKVIRPEFLDSERARERFRREVAAAARLDHPSICTVYGAGEVQGQPYLALRYVEGESLEQQLRSARASNQGVWSGERQRDGTGSSGTRLRPVDLRPALELVESLARAVHVAHKAGLVHRDVKPANVMVTAGGQPVLMDFGLARDTGSSALSLTQSQDLIGTPAYMAPEQVKAGDVDRRTDVHALGVLLYECLTLRLPYVGRNREELYRSILSETPIELRRLQPAASRALSTVVHQALAKEPHRRYATALLLAEDLRAVLEDRPTVARPPGPLVAAWIWARRHRAAAAVGVALMLGLVSSLLLLVRSLDAERRSHSVALVTRAAAVRADPEQSFRILKDAFELSPEPEVVVAICEVLAELQDWRLVRETNGRVESVTRSPSGRWFVVGAAPAAIHRVDGSFWCKLPWPILPQQPALAFSPNENELLVAHWVGDKDYREVAHCDLRSNVPACTTFGDASRRGTPTDIAWAKDGRVAITFVNKGVAHAEVYDEHGLRLPNMSNIRLPDRTHGCAFLADGRLALATGIYSRAGGLEVPFELAHRGAWPAEVRRILPVGDEVVVASTAGVQVFSASGNRVREQLRPIGHESEQLEHVEAARDGTLLIVFHDGRVWSLAPSGELNAWQEGATGTVREAHFTPDEQRIVTGNWRGHVTIRDRAGQLLDQWQGHQHAVFCAAIGDDAASFLTGSWDGSVKIWTPGRVPGLPFRSGFARAALHRAGDLLVVAAADGRLLALDSRGEVVVESRQDIAGFPVLHGDRDGRSVWVQSFPSCELQRWTPGTNELGAPLRPDYAQRGLATVAHLESGLFLTASGSPDSAASMLDPVSARVSHLKNAAGENLIASHTAAALGGSVAVTIGKGMLRVHDGQGTVLWQEPDPVATGERTSDATSLVLSDDGRFAVIGRDDGSVSFWDLQARRRQLRWTDHRSRVRDVAVSRDSSHVASVTSEGHLVVRAVGASDRPVLEWHSKGETLESVVFFGPDAVVTGGWRNSGRLRWWWWDPEVLEEKLERVRAATEKR